MRGDSRLLRLRLPGRGSAVALAAVLLCGGGGVRDALGQASAQLPTSHPLYEWLNALGVWGLTDVVPHRRPISRLEAARRTLAAEVALERLESTDAAQATTGAGSDPAVEGRIRSARAMLASLRAALAPEVSRIVGEDGAKRAWGWPSELSVTAADSPGRRVPDNPFGAADAGVDPLLDRPGGRPVADGFTVALESAPHARLGEHAVVQARLRARSLRPRDGAGVATGVDVQELYARLVVGGLALRGGRGEIRWGQARQGNLVFSDRALPPWSVRVSTEGRARLPGFLGGLGPLEAELLWADLGSRQNFPGANLLAYHLSLEPHPRLRIGAGMATHFGGRGAPEYTIGGILQDLALLLDDERQFSNKFAGTDFRLILSASRGVVLYGEIVLDDVDANPARLLRWIREEVGHVYGLEWVRPAPSGLLSAYAEFHHTGHRYYRHRQFTSGFTHRGRLLGDPLGPDADGVYAGVVVDAWTGALLHIGGAWERRSADIYTTESGGPPGDRGYLRLEDIAEETRWRLSAESWFGLGATPWKARVFVGAERASDFAHERGARRTSWTTEFALAYGPHAG